MPCEINPHKTVREHGGCDTCLTNVRSAAKRYEKTGRLPKPDSVVMQILTFLDVSKIRTKQETVQRLVDALQKPEAAEVQSEMLADLLAWTLRAQDVLPLPVRRYVVKTDPHNYWAPYR